MFTRIASALLFSFSFYAAANPQCTPKLDVLFVVDNSASMDPVQRILSESARAMFADLTERGYDFRVAVTTSEAYLAEQGFHNNSEYALFRDGSGTLHTGVRVIDNNTPNKNDVFAINVNQGGSGSGDERAFSGFQASLLNPGNPEFLRPDSFLSVVILSDEDDFSSASRMEYSWLNKGGIPDHDYTSSSLDPVSDYTKFLDDITHSPPYARRYSVSAIAVIDGDCLKTHVMDSPSSIIGKRYMEIVNKTDGTPGSICSTTFVPVLHQLVEKIAHGN